MVILEHLRYFVANSFLLQLRFFCVNVLCPKLQSRNIFDKYDVCKWVGETDSKGDTHCNNPPQCYFLRIEIVLCMVVVRYLIWRDEQLHKNLGYCLSYRFIEKYYVWLGVTYIGLDSKKVLTSSSS